MYITYLVGLVSWWNVGTGDFMTTTTTDQLTIYSILVFIPVVCLHPRNRRTCRVERGNGISDWVESDWGYFLFCGGWCRDLWYTCFIVEGCREGGCRAGVAS